MKITKKLLSVTLCLMLLLGVVAVGGGGFTGLFPKAEATSTFKKSDVVYFGSYPQSNVKDEALIEQLNSQSAQWHSYEYVSGTGTGTYNQLTQSDYIVSDFMKYKDVTYNGEKYRGVYFDNVRPSDTYYQFPDYNSMCGYEVGTTHWFKYEPLSWIILDPSSGLALSEAVIDNQPFNNYKYDANWGNANEPHYYANNYGKSSIKAWLNGNFFDWAFSDAQKDFIIPLTHTDACTTYEYGTEESYSKYVNSTSTDDIVYLLSVDDVNTYIGGGSLGRADDYSEYARSQGLVLDYSANTPAWILRTPVDGYYSPIYCLNYVGEVKTTYTTTLYGIRPAIQLDLTDESLLMTLTYDANGGTNPPAAQKGNGSLNLTKDLPTRGGYYFAEWNTKPDGSGESYGAGAKYTLKKDTTLYAIWTDSIEFGSYPQSRVTDESLISALNAQSASWVSYGYYSGTGSYDGQMTAKDFMQYKDVTYKGEKYRGVIIAAYRPSESSKTSSADNSSQDDNGYNTGVVYWFKFDPLKWRLLDNDSGLMVCQTIIDCQPYNNYMLQDGTFLFENVYALIYGNSNKDYEAADYEKSSLRAWLKDEFCATAFTDSETAKTKADDLGDKVFLLSKAEVNNTDYFSGSDTRQAKGSEYAECQGLPVSSNSYSAWYIKSSFLESNSYVSDHYGNNYVHSDGFSVGDRSSAVFGNYGVRPAIMLDLSEKTTLYYNANNGTGAPASQTHYDGKATVSGIEPTRTGYAFNCWNTKEDGTGTDYKANDVLTLSSDTTLFAKWDKICTITYLPNGGSGEPSPQTGIGKITLSSTKPVWEGHTFKEWNTMLEGDGESYNPGDSFSVVEDMTLFAQWTDSAATEYTAKFVSDGKTVSEKKYKEGDAIAKPANPTKSGYTFKEWNPAVPAKMPAKDMTFTAVFTKNQDNPATSTNPDKPDNPSQTEPTVKIKNYKQSLSVDYKAKLTFHAEVKDADGYEIVWLVNGSPSGQKGDTFTINQATVKEYKISASLVKGGKTAKTSDTETITVNTGFFAKIIAFFRGLFKALPEYEDNTKIK